MGVVKAVIFDFFGVMLLGGEAPNRPLLDLVKAELKPKYKVAILSNARQDYPSQALEPDDRQLFEEVVLTYREGVAKPQPEAFRLAAERLALSTDDCIFIDDSKSHCEGAEKAGMKAIHYRGFDQFRADLDRLLKAAADN